MKHSLQLKPAGYPPKVDVALWLLVCAILGLSVVVYTLRMERARDLRDIEGLTVRAGALEKENAALKGRANHAMPRPDQNTVSPALRIEREVVIPAKAMGETASTDLKRARHAQTGKPVAAGKIEAPRGIEVAP